MKGDMHYLAKEEAERIVRSNPQSSLFNNLMEFISDSVSFISDFDDCVHAVVNNATDHSDESVKDLKRFVLQMTYQMARESLEKEYTL